MSNINLLDTSSSDDSDYEPLWDSTDTDSDSGLPPSKVSKLHHDNENLDDDSDCEDYGGDSLCEDGTRQITVTVGPDGLARSKLFNNALNDDSSTFLPLEQLGDGAAYEVRRFNSLREVITFMDYYQQETMTHFTSFSRHGAFGDEKHIPNVQRGRIYFESLKGKCGMPIMYDGVPFMHIGRWSFGCHQGADRNIRQKELYHLKRKQKAKKEGVKLESRLRSSKKVNCPAEIYISHVVKFPQFEVSVTTDNQLPSEQERRNVKRRLSEQYKTDPRSIVCQHCYYVRLPQPWAHKGHPVLATVGSLDSSEVPSGTKMTLNSEAVARLYDRRRNAIESLVVRTKEPVDQRVLDKIRELYKQGVTQEQDIRAAVNTYVKDELLAGKSKPPAIFRRFNPTHKDLSNQIVKAREELRAEKAAEQREVCSSLVSELAHLIPALDDTEALDHLQEQLSALYEVVRGAVPPCISNPDENVIAETTVEQTKEGCGGLLLTDQTTIVLPQTITVAPQQTQEIQITPEGSTHAILHAADGAMLTQHRQQGVTYQSYTVQPLASIGGLESISTTTVDPQHAYSISEGGYSISTPQYYRDRRAGTGWYPIT